MYNPRQVIFTITLERKGGDVPVEVIAHAIEESIRAYAGMNTQTHIEEVGEGTLKISITQKVDLIPCSFNQGVAILNDLQDNRLTQIAPHI